MKWVNETSVRVAISAQSDLATSGPTRKSKVRHFLLPVGFKYEMIPFYLFSNISSRASFNE